ncbi:MAG: glycosyltransferase family 1 protein [Magnetococcales bacterium]|nr:glycosyltransferase family 1 protein [Magnetococcales bacterium]
MTTSQKSSNNIEVADTYFLDARAAAAAAAKGVMISDENGGSRLQMCYYNGPEYKQMTPNLICVPYEQLGDFFAKNSLPPPKNLHIPHGIPESQQKELHGLFQHIMNSVTTLKKHSAEIGVDKQNPIPRRHHAFFFCRKTAFQVAQEGNYLQQTVGGRYEVQKCYYEGKPFQNPPKNLITLPFSDLISLPFRAIPDHFAALHGSYPSVLYWPDVNDSLERQTIQTLFAHAQQQAERRMSGKSISMAPVLRPDLGGVIEILLDLFFPDTINRIDDPQYIEFLTVVNKNNYHELITWIRVNQELRFSISNFVEKIVDLFTHNHVEQGVALLEIFLGLTMHDSKHRMLVEIFGNYFRKNGMNEAMQALCLRTNWDDTIAQDFLNTFANELTIDSLIDIQDQLVFLMPLSDNELNNRAERIGARIRKQMLDLAGHKEVLSASQIRHESNKQLLAKIDPIFPSYCERLQFGTAAFEKMLQINGTIYYFHNDVWQRLGEIRPEENSKRPFWQSAEFFTCFYRSESIGDITRQILSFKTKSSIIFKHHCYFILPFSWLNSILAAVDLSFLDKATHVIRWVDDDNLDESLANLYAYLGHPFSQDIVPKTQSNEAFRSVRFLDVNNTLIGMYHKSNENYFNELHSYYQPSFPTTIPEKIRNNNLRVFFITSRFTTYLQYCTRDLCEGFESLGYACHVFKEGPYDGMNNRVEPLLKKLVEFKPDVIITISYLRYETPAIPEHIPFISWVQDILGGISRGEFLDRINDKDIILSEMHHDELELAGYKNYIKFPTLSNDRLFNMPPSVEYDYDISFVAHYSDIPSLANKQINDFVYNIMENTLLEPQDDPRHGITRVQDYIDIIEPYIKETFPGISLGFQDYRSISRQAGNQIWRKKILRWIIEGGYALSIFGLDWDRHPLFKPYAKGPTPHGNGSVLVYNRSRINLQLNPFTTLHHRVFEVIGSGGFLLLGRIDPRKDLNQLTDFLQEGEGYVFFDGRKDLLSKIDYYLKNDQERIEIVERGRNRVLREHNYAQGAGKILQILSQRFDHYQSQK